MKFQSLGLVLLLVLLGEFVQTRDAHKSIRPYKFYRSRPRGHKPRWPRFPQTRYRHFRKGPPPKPHYRPPNGPRHGRPTDHVSDEQSYTIEIELPKRQRDYTRNNDHYHRIHIRKDAEEDSPDNDDYDEDDDFEERVLQTGKKKVRIKVAKGDGPKLRIKISRNDNLTEVAGLVAASAIRGPGSSPGDSSVSLEKLGQMVRAEWTPGNPVPSFPVALRGA